MLLVHLENDSYQKASDATNTDHRLTNGTQNYISHTTTRTQLKLSNQLSLPQQDYCNTKKDTKYCITKQETNTRQIADSINQF